MTDIAIRCAAVTKHFGCIKAVDRANLALPEGRILALLGPSGCGKTTMLRLVAGFEVPDAGVVEINGRLVAGNGCFVSPEKRRVGVVFQDCALFPHLDVLDNVAYGLAKSGDQGSRVTAILNLVGLKGLESRMPHELSGGQQQRVALARALVPHPDVVLLDEPFSNLDAALRVRLRSEVRRILKAAGATAIFVTHDQEEALSLADEVALMLRGQIMQVAEPEELYHRPSSKEVAAFVGEADFLPGEVSDGQVSCELGRFQSRTAASGEVDVMFRPENTQPILHPDGPCEVVLREFFGHDQLVTVRLPSGDRIRARVGPEADFAPGDRVRVRVRGDVTVFPAPSRASSSGLDSELAVLAEETFGAADACSSRTAAAGANTANVACVSSGRRETC
ncbi:MAG: ABC transporter ATP-binding protein [Chloroflexi bacterium]|nr:ABC transporter ATP-binding protein [Chloroflexota bacterium]